MFDLFSILENLVLVLIFIRFKFVVYNLLYLCGLMGNSFSNSDDEDDKEFREVMKMFCFIEICD